jgi:hypothetical protein
LFWTKRMVIPCRPLITHSCIHPHVGMLVGESTLGWKKTAHRDNPFLMHYEIKYTRKIWQKHAKTKYFESNGPCGRVL